MECVNVCVIAQRRRLCPALLRGGVGTPFISKTKVQCGVHSIKCVWLPVAVSALNEEPSLGVREVAL